MKKEDTEEKVKVTEEKAEDIEKEKKIEKKEEKTEKIEEKPKKINFVVVIVILLLSAGLFCGGYFLAAKQFDNKKTEEKKEDTSDKKEETKEDKDNNQEDNKEDNKDKEDNKKPTIKELSVDDEKIQAVYEYAPCYDRMGNFEEAVPSAYQNRKVTVDNISSEALLANAEKITPYEDGTALEIAERIYGRKIKPVNYVNGDVTYTYKDGEYEIDSPPGEIWVWTTYIRDITRAYEDDDYLYIEDKVLFVLVDGEDPDSFDEDEVYSKMVLKGGDIKNKNKIYGKESYREYTCEDDDAECGGMSIFDMLEDFSKKYENKKVKYKHTFKKNKNGSYIWVSSEPIS